MFSFTFFYVVVVAIVVTCGKDGLVSVFYLCVCVLDVLTENRKQPANEMFIEDEKQFTVDR